MNKTPLTAFVLLLALGCGDDAGSDAPGADAGTDLADASSNEPDADTDPVADAMPEPDADLSDHGFVTVDGTELVFDETATYVNTEGINDVTINGTVGPDCPLGDDCTTLYVTVPGDAQLGSYDCDDLGVSVQLNEAGGERFFSFNEDGLGNAGCSFRLTAFGTEAGEQVAVENLSATLEEYLNPGNRRLLSDGELRATMQ